MRIRTRSIACLAAGCGALLVGCSSSSSMHADRSSGGVSVSQACRDHLTADLHAGPVRLGAGDDAAQLAYEHYLALGRPDAASPRHDLHRAIISARP